MNSLPPAIERLPAFLGKLLAEVEQLTPDASTREFFRAHTLDGTFIVCAYPEPFVDGELPQIDVTNLFRSVGIPVAEIVKYDGTNGLVLHEDFGDRILRDELNETTREEFLSEAIELIGEIQAATDIAVVTGSIAGKLKFDHEKLFWELEFFRDHYFGSLLGLKTDLSPLTKEFSALADEIEGFSKVLTHRDYHSANLMVGDENDLKIIDHQDARIGPATYDLVSLVLDRIEEIPSEEEIDWAIATLQDARTGNGLDLIENIDYEFDLVTIQRCLKAIGTFSNQSANHGKRDYLKYVPAMFSAVAVACERIEKYPEIMNLAQKESKRTF